MYRSGSTLSIHEIAVNRIARIYSQLSSVQQPSIRQNIQMYIDMHVPLLNAALSETRSISAVYAKKLAPDQSTEFPIAFRYHTRWMRYITLVWHPSADHVNPADGHITKFLSKGGHMPPSARHITDHMKSASRDTVLEPLVRDILSAALLFAHPNDAVLNQNSIKERCEIYSLGTGELCDMFIKDKTSRNVVDVISQFISACTYSSSVLIKSLRQCPIKHAHYKSGMHRQNNGTARRRRRHDLPRFSCALVFNALCAELNTTRKLPGRVLSCMEHSEISRIVKRALVSPYGTCVYKETLIDAGCSSTAVQLVFRSVLPTNILFRTKGIKVKLPVLSDRDWSILFICVKSQQQRMRIRIETSGSLALRSPVYATICARCFTFRSLVPNTKRITKRTIGVVTNIDNDDPPMLMCNSCKIASVFLIDMTAQQIKQGPDAFAVCRTCQSFGRITTVGDMHTCLPCAKQLTSLPRPNCHCGEPYVCTEGAMYTYTDRFRSVSVAYLCKQHWYIFLGRHYTYDEHATTVALICA